MQWCGASRGGRTVDKSRAKRGRPRGSKNKVKQLEIPASFSSDDFDGEDVASRARQIWRVGKQVGVVFEGDEEVIIQRLEKQVRANHPNLN